MTTTPPEAPSAATPPPGPRVTGDQVRDLSRLRRNVVDRKVAGVAGGLARHLDIDPVIVRVAFVVLSLFGGAGLIVYAACWILVPEEHQDTAPLGLDDRSRSIALLLVGILGIAVVVGRWDWFWIPGPLILVALVVWLVLSRRNGPTPPPAAQPYAGYPPYAAPTVPGAPAGAVSPEQRMTATPPAYAAAPAYVQTAYAPTSTPPMYAAPAPPAAAVAPTPVRPRNPRKRGPILFWFTLALITLAEGVLGMVDLAGVAVTGSAYPALAVAITAAMLLVGSVYGRAGGLILVGLLATGVTVVGLASERYEGDRIEVVPDSAAQVQDTYDYSTGEYVLDLSLLTDPEDLDGRTIRLTGDVGELDVVVPRGMDVMVTGRVNGPGAMTIFGNETGGIDTERTFTHDGGTDVPQLTLDIELEVGHIDVGTR